MNRTELAQADESPLNGAGQDMLARGQALQQVRTSFVTAVSVQRPRKIPEVRRRLMEEARLAGESFYYGWGAGKNRVEGPSIDLAVAAARCWGNCATDLLPVQDLPDCWVFTASFIDLETGYTRTRQFRQSKKWSVHGNFDDERRDDIRFQIGQSKAERNVIIKAIPKSLIDEAMEEAKAGVRRKIEEYVGKNGLAAAADLVLKGLAKCGIKEAAVLEKVGVAARTALTVDHLVVLRGDLHAIESGQEHAETLYPGAGEGARKAEEKLEPKPANGAGGKNGGQGAAPAGEAAKPAEAPRGQQPAPDLPPDQDEMALQDTVTDLGQRIAGAETLTDLEQAGADLVRHRGWMGEQRHAALLVEYRKRQAELAAQRQGAARGKGREANF